MFSALDQRHNRKSNANCSAPAEDLIRNTTRPMRIATLLSKSCNWGTEKTCQVTSKLTIGQDIPEYGAGWLPLPGILHAHVLILRILCQADPCCVQE